MFRLASKLGIIDEDVKASFAKFCTSEKEAIKYIITAWLKSQDSREEAYFNLAEALIHPDVGLSLVAREVLDYSVAEPDSLVTNRKFKIKK